MHPQADAGGGGSHPHVSLGLAEIVFRAMSDAKLQDERCDQPGLNQKKKDGGDGLPSVDLPDGRLAISQEGARGQGRLIEAEPAQLHRVDAVGVRDHGGKELVRRPAAEQRRDQRRRIAGHLVRGGDIAAHRAVRPEVARGAVDRGRRDRDEVSLQLLRNEALSGAVLMQSGQIDHRVARQPSQPGTHLVERQAVPELDGETGRHRPKAVAQQRLEGSVSKRRAGNDDDPLGRRIEPERELDRLVRLDHDGSADDRQLPAD